MLPSSALQELFHRKSSGQESVLPETSMDKCGVAANWHRAPDLCKEWGQWY